MKAYIVEIYKNYCIVMTADGQFIRQNIPAGFHEIGDEISWEESGVLNAGKSNLMRMIGRVAIGFAAVAVITTGAYFGIKFANVNSTAGTVSLAQATSQEKKITEVPERDENGAVAESSQQEASDVSVEILKAQPSEEMSQASMLYEAN